MGKTQIYSILKDKEKILEKWQAGNNGNTKYLKARKSRYEDVNDVVWDWFTKARSRQMTVSGALLQEKAKELAREMGKEDFAASNGWLECWKKRYGAKVSKIDRVEVMYIVFCCFIMTTSAVIFFTLLQVAVLSGEGAAVSEATVTDWKSRLPSICDGYAPADIFNADETGLFFRMLPNRSLVSKADSCKGEKSYNDHRSQ